MIDLRAETYRPKCANLRPDDHSIVAARPGSSATPRARPVESRLPGALSPRASRSTRHRLRRLFKN